MHPAKFIKIFILAFLCSCGKTDERPRDLLPENKIVEVMVDIHIFEAMAEGKKLSADSMAVFIKSNYQRIFQKHGMIETQFTRTFEYYERHPDKMDKMMQKVTERLSAMEAEVKGEKENQSIQEHE